MTGDGKMKKTRQNKKMNNQGVALVTVIVIISFISVLATVVLYTSGINFAMKTTDIKTKVSFYDTETAMEQLKAYFTGEASKAFETAYAETLTNYGNWGNGTGRESHYKATFFSTLQANLTKELADSGCADMTAFLNTKVDPKYAGMITLSPGGTGTYDTSKVGEGYVLFKGVQIVYTENGYTTKITTDFLINLPEQNWAAEYSEKNSAPAHAEDILDLDLKMTDFVKYYNWSKQ